MGGTLRMSEKEAIARGLIPPPPPKPSEAKRVFHFHPEPAKEPLANFMKFAMWWLLGFACALFFK